MALAVVIFLTAAGFFVMYSATEDVEGSKSDKDSRGYYYMDSLDPSPKTTYNWVDVAGSGSSTNLFISGSSGHGTIDLTWDFPYYGIDYTRIHVAARGYLCFNSWYLSYGYSSGMPQSSNPNPMIAVMWGFGYGNAYYLTGITNNVNWVAIEWVLNSYGMHYEVILYETGVIKMQYDRTGSSSYQGGYYHTIGIEDETGSVGIQYKGFYDQTMEDQMAIEWSFAEADISDFKVENAHLDFNNTQTGEMIPVCYAEMEYYKFTFNATSTHPTSGANDLSDIRVYFGPPSLGIFAQYTLLGGSAWWQMGGGDSGAGNGTIEIDLDRSRTETNRLGDPWNMVLYVKFLFAFPMNGFLPVTIWARGGAALPTQMTLEDAFYLDTYVDLAGEVVVHGDGGRVLRSGGFTRDNETITFSGAMLVYNMTDLSDPNKTYYPPNASFFFVVVDEELTEYTDTNVSGREFSISLNMPLRKLTKEFRVLIRGIPSEKINGELPTISLEVDDSIPTAPSSLVIRADSFKDKQKEVDNDDILYVSWGSVVDSGSGVMEYKISSSPDPNNESAIVLDPRITSYVWNGTVPGEFRLYVWAVDKVGHIGEMASKSIKIDKSDPFFTDFSLDQNVWVRTLTPTIAINARDGWTVSDDVSGVRRSTAEYSISTEGLDEYEDWISVGLYDDEVTRATGTEITEIKIQPRFVEGTENYIRFRIKDWAGNGYAVSEDYNLKIDVTEVAFEDFFPTQGVWHNLDVVNVKEVSVYLVDDTSGVDTTYLYYRISHELDENGNYVWSTGIQQQGGWEDLPRKWYDKVDGNNRVWIHFPYEEFQEGELNFIQFIAKDYAGNGQYTGQPRGPWTQSPMYQILVNTKPHAIISAPRNFQHFNLTDLITFDGSQSFDIDIDKGNLKFEWKEGNTTLSRDMVFENYRFETTGFHTITLYVGDSGHKGSDRAVASVIVNITSFTPSPLMDSDNDGMDDLWEWNNLLNYLDGSDRDEDPDGDGYTNIQEYRGTDGSARTRDDATNPWDPASKPAFKGRDDPAPVIKNPFDIWVFIAIIVAAIIIAALIVLIGYLRIHRDEDKVKREEAEEEAMLATPQLDIPTMPAMPMVDTSVPTLPSPETQVDESAALPPAQPVEGEPLPTEPAPVDYGEPQPVPEAAPPEENPPVYDPNQPQGENPAYQG